MSSIVRTFVINAVKTVKNVFGGAKKKPESPTNPWEADLARLAELRGAEAEVEPPAADEITQFVNGLAKAANKDAPQATDLPKPPRRLDPTVTDMKAWWGESVATWDPETDKDNVTSADQRNRIRPATWLNKGPSTFDK